MPQIPIQADVQAPDRSAIERFEERLRRAAAAFCVETERRCLPLGDHALPALLRRLGWSGRLDLAEPRCRRDILERLRQDDRRLMRAARTGRPGYDFGRHLAVRRLACALGREAPAAETAHPPSGADLNRRFRRRGPRGV